jgi:type VI protein secretion system component VasF
MRIAELCEPLFQYACLLSRSGRREGTHSLNQVRSEVSALFDDMAAKAAAEPKLRAVYDRVELVLMVFMDWTIKESGLRFAREWRDLARDKGEEEGDEKFFDMLDDALRDPGPQAAEALGVFYTCLGLGFTGWYAGQPDHLRKRQREIAARLRISGEPDRAARIVPEAYEHVDTSNLIQTPGTSLLGIGIALVGLTIVLFVANAYLYRASSRDLNAAVGDIVGHGRPATQAVK